MVKLKNIRQNIARRKTRRRTIMLLTVLFFLLLIVASFIRMANNPEFRRSGLPLGTVEDALSVDLQSITEVSIVKLEQGNISYKSGGKGENIVLIHSWAGSKEYWKYTIHGLIDNYRVYALDLKGFGDSDKPKDGYTMADYSNLIADFFDTLKIDKATVVGHSLGGKIAVSFAEQYPSKIEKLVLVDTPVSKISVGLRIFTWRVIGKPWYYVVRAIGKYTFQSPEAKSSWLKPTGNSAVKSMKAFARTDLTDKLLNIDAPALVILGEHDRSTAASQVNIFLQNLKNVKLAIVKKAGHSPMSENPKAFNRLLIDFLDGRLSS